MRVQIVVYNKVLAKYFGLHLWKITKVLPKRNKWKGIQVEGIDQTGNFAGQKCSIFLKEGEYRFLE